MLQDVTGRFGEAQLVYSTEQCVQNDVVSFKGSIRLELTTPVTLVMLLGEKKPPARIRGGCYSAGQIVNFSEAKLRRGGRT
jgi:hypothetical protein